MIYDVAIVGGGPAGLTASLWLARYLHSVVVIDSGDPRNWETRGINGFLGSQGIKSPELRAKGRTDAKSFGVEFIDEEVCKVQNTNGEHFVLTLNKGGTIEARPPPPRDRHQGRLAGYPRTRRLLRRDSARLS